MAGGAGALWAAVPAGTAQLRHCLDEMQRLEQCSHVHPWSRRQLADSVAAGHHVQLLYCDGGLIGYYVAMPVIDEAHLLNIAVHPDYRSRGWGRRLLRHLAEWADARGCVSVLLEVRRSNCAAIGLYRSMRFQPVAVRADYYPQPDAAPGQPQREDALLMRLLLPSAPLQQASGMGRTA